MSSKQSRGQTGLPSKVGKQHLHLASTSQIEGCPALNDDDGGDDGVDDGGRIDDALDEAKHQRTTIITMVNVLYNLIFCQQIVVFCTDIVSAHVTCIYLAESLLAGVREMGGVVTGCRLIEMWTGHDEDNKTFCFFRVLCPCEDNKE